VRSIHIIHVVIDPTILQLSDQHGVLAVVQAQDERRPVIPPQELSSEEAQDVDRLLLRDLHVGQHLVGEHRHVLTDSDLTAYLTRRNLLVEDGPQNELGHLEDRR